MVIRAGPQATGSGLHQGRTVPGPTCPRLRSTVGGRDLGCDHRDPARAQDQPIVQIAWKGIGNWIQGGRAPARGGRHQTLPLPGGTPASRAGGGLVTHMRLRLGFGRLVADRAKREGPSSFGCTVYGVSLELGPGSAVRVPLEPPFLVREQPLGRARGDSQGFTTRRLRRAPRSRSRSGQSGVGHRIIGLTAAKGPSPSAGMV